MGYFYVCKNSFWFNECRDNFQCAMDISFIEEKDKFVVVYMDDIIVYSRYDSEHINSLEKSFMKCRKYGISLNP